MGVIDKPVVNAFKTMLQLDVIRGPHSTGIARFDEYEETTVLKKALLPTDLFDLRQCDDLLAVYHNPKILLGHNRWATAGAVNHTNAHPFEFDTIVGAHNGTLVNQRLLPDYQEFDVDSENIFHSFEKLGVAETIEQLHGAFALTWFDTSDGKMHFVRNTERDLWYAFSADKKTFFWASEPFMIEVATERVKLAMCTPQQFGTLEHYWIEPHLRGDNLLDRFFKCRVKGYTPPKKPATRGRIITGNVSTESQKSTGNGGTSGTTKNINSYEPRFKEGDRVVFCGGSQDSRFVNFLTGYDPATGEALFKIMLPKGSELRREIEQNPGWWFAGTINGIDKSAWYIIQGGSVTQHWSLTLEEKAQCVNSTLYSPDVSDEDREYDEIADEWDEHVQIIESIGECGWCTSPLDPAEDNVIINQHAAFCPSCKELDEVKHFIPEN